MAKCKRPIGDEEFWDLLDGSDSCERLKDLRVHLATCENCADRFAEISRLHADLEDICRPSEIPLPKRVGPYEIVRAIGEGGMGIVYEAEQEEPRRGVALKIMRATAPNIADGARSFRREIAALARMRHPGLVTIFDAGRAEDGRLYFVMELVQGVPIDEHCRAHDLSLQQRTKLCLDVIEAIAHAHERGILHRDLKPANVLVDDSGEVRVLDFGLARFLEPIIDVSQSVIASPVGTLPYMSPEQLGASEGTTGEVDARSDVYSCGVILYELLTGALPHPPKRNFAAAVRARVENVPRHPSRVSRQIPRALGDIVMKAITADPARRDASMSEFAIDLQRFLSGRRVEARSREIRSTLRDFAGRHRVPIAVLGTCIFATAIALGARPSNSDEDRNPRSRVVTGGPELGALDVHRPRNFDIHGNGKEWLVVQEGRLALWSRSGGETAPIDLAIDCNEVRMPRYSPDHRRVAFIAMREVPPELRQNELGVEAVLCVQDRDRKASIDVARFTEPPRDLCWRRDGSALSCIVEDSVVTYSLEGVELSRIDIENIHKLGGYSEMDRWLLATTFVEGRFETFLLCADMPTAKPTRCTFGRQAPTRDAIFAPDSRTICYVEHGTRTSELREAGFDVASGVMSATSSLLASHRDEWIYHSQYVRGGTEIDCVVSERVNSLLVSHEGAIERFRNIARGMHPRLSPDGKLLYFLPEGEPGLSLVGLSDLGIRRRIVEDELLDTPSFYIAPFALSPNGDRVCYSIARTDGEPGADLLVVPSAGGAATRVAQSRSRTAFGRWSPEGRWLTYLDEDGLHVVKPDGQTASRCLAPSFGGEEVPHWSPTGDAIAFLGYERRADRRDRPAVLHVAFPSGATRRLDDATLSTWKEGLDWHPSGSFVTYCDDASSHKPKIRRLFLDGQPSDVLIDQPRHWDYIGHWTPDGRRFYFLSHSKEHVEAAHVYDLEKRRVVVHDLGAWPSDWSRDGRLAAWSMGATTTLFERLRLR
ncbi:MAG: serine/threonine-protein kinase [Planctomycetes bacterium]|nr:serine/threonine-protein kinase [Planctomycetota bacterium]MCB9890498.1 serine/threonine-protein kinase [Planctomycetota bacterium]MCB9917739.1 serine/threonine-protein kinase [Planctomycetota bacterium]